MGRNAVKTRLSANARPIAAGRATKTPIDKLWLSHEIGAFVDDNTIVFDETLPHNLVDSYMPCAQPGSYIANPRKQRRLHAGRRVRGEARRPR